MIFLFSENNNSYNKQQLLGNVKTWNFKIINWNTIATDITFYKQYWITKWNITDIITSLMFTQGNTEIPFSFSFFSEHWESPWRTGSLYTHLIIGNQSDAKAGFQNFESFSIHELGFGRLLVLRKITTTYTCFCILMLWHLGVLLTL